MTPSWFDYGLGIGGFGVALVFAGWLLWTQDRRITTLIDRLTAWSAPDGGGWCRRCGAITGNDAPHQPWCPTKPDPQLSEEDDDGASGS